MAVLTALTTRLLRSTASPLTGMLTVKQAKSKKGKKSMAKGFATAWFMQFRDSTPPSAVEVNYFAVHRPQRRTIIQNQQGMPFPEH